MRLLLLLLLCDTSGRREPSIAVEKLGATWSAGAAGEDRGLHVHRYFNHLLSRDEFWHHAATGEWFLRDRDGLYVHAEQAGESWLTRPQTRLVWRGGEWKRIKAR